MTVRKRVGNGYKREMTPSQNGSHGGGKKGDSIPGGEGVEQEWDTEAKTKGNPAPIEEGMPTEERQKEAEEKGRNQRKTLGGGGGEGCPAEKLLVGIVKGAGDTERS